MSKFVVITDHEGWERVVNVDEIADVTPYKKDWREGAIVTTRRDRGGFRVNAIQAQELRSKLLNL